jgi:hypothetical protein
MTTLTHSSFYHLTCKFCTVVRNVLVTIFLGMIAFGESAGRARAANILAQHGRMDLAKEIMLGKESKDD